MTLKATGIGLGLLGVCLGACGGGEPPRPGDGAGPGPEEAIPSAYTVVEVPDGGTIRGAIRFAGEVPDATLIQVVDDSVACGATQPVQTVVTDSEGGLADVVVSLIDVRRGAPFRASDTPVLDQRGCRFHPHVVFVPVGTPVSVLNSDPVTHNVHTAAFDNRPVNRSQAPRSGAIELIFDAAEKVRVKCDLHPWMSAWIVVMDHPYHAVTDSTGSFALPAIPPGDYVLETWHEELGTSRRRVSVIRGETTDLAIELPSDE